MNRDHNQGNDNNAPSANKLQVKLNKKRPKEELGSESNPVSDEPNKKKSRSERTAWN